MAGQPHAPVSRRGFKGTMRRFGIWFKGGTVALDKHDAAERAARKIPEPPKTERRQLTRDEYRKVYGINWD